MHVKIFLVPILVKIVLFCICCYAQHGIRKHELNINDLKIVNIKSVKRIPRSFHNRNRKSNRQLCGKHWFTNK